MLSISSFARIILPLAIAALALTACTGGSTSTATIDNRGGSANGNSSDTVTLIHFNDLHAHLTSHLDRVAVAAISGAPATSKIQERGGLARAATLIKQIRSENPNSILMNIGDTYHGGVEAMFTLGNAVADPMNALGVDIGVPGNWDFAYDPNVTRLRYASLTTQETSVLQSALSISTGGLIRTIKKPNFPNLAANVTFTQPANKAGQPFLPPTWTTVRGGIKVGFIGITSDIVPRMSRVLAIGLSFVQGEAAYKTLIEQQAKSLRDGGSQLVFVMSELGIHRDKQLADHISSGSVDVFFSAHTHEATFTPLVSSSGALVVEAGNDGYIGRMDATVKPGVKPVFVWKLMPLDKTVAEDPTMKALVDKERAPYLVANPNIKFPMNYANVTLSQSITTVIGKTSGSLDRRHALENTFNRVFTDALRTRTGTQLAMTPGFRFDSVIAANELLEDNTIANGDITLEDVYRFFPVIYTLSTANITGQRVKEIVEQGLTSVFSRDAFDQGGGWFEGFSGINLSVDVAGTNGARIKNVSLPGGRPLLDTTTYSITGCTRPDDFLTGTDVLCSYSGFTNVAGITNAATGSPYTVQEMFIDLMAPAAGGNAIVPLPNGTNHHTDVSNTAVWPQTPFVQPLW
jgi:2',3'-cyclic-nucleotide 2'-phosphodiesterase (5'-nucleotidase family)